MKHEEIVTKLSENLPFKMNTDFGISSVINKQILLDNFGDTFIKVRTNAEDAYLTEKRDLYTSMSIKNYVKDHLDKKQHLYYLDAEDGYDFLFEIGLKTSILDKYNFGKDGRLSLWWGSKNTLCPFHYDSYGFKQDKMIKQINGKDFYKKAYRHSILTVLDGKKKIYIIHPKYSQYLKYGESFQSGAAYCTEEKENILNNENIEYETIILNAGESLNIPMFWWHRVENLEETIAIGHNFCL
jgi:hypothetical protein